MKEVQNNTFKGLFLNLYQKSHFVNENTTLVNLPSQGKWLFLT
jgi:hypothetical protein